MGKIVHWVSSQAYFRFRHRNCHQNIYLAVDIAALNHYNKHYASERNSKMTLAPSNISHLYESVVDFINNGMMSININCVFEEGWNKETAEIEYKQLQRLANYIIANTVCPSALHDAQSLLIGHS